MTATFQTSVFADSRNNGYKRFGRYTSLSEDLYQAEITDFDGEQYEYEISARSFEEAAAKVESIANESGIYVYNMELYLVG